MKLKSVQRDVKFLNKSLVSDQLNDESTIINIVWWKVSDHVWDIVERPVDVQVCERIYRNIMDLKL